MNRVLPLFPTLTTPTAQPDIVPEQTGAQSGLKGEQQAFDLFARRRPQRPEPRLIASPVDHPLRLTIRTAKLGATRNDQRQNHDSRRHQQQYPVPPHHFAPRRKARADNSSRLYCSRRLTTTTVRMPSTTASGTWVMAKIDRNLTSAPPNPVAGSGKASASWTEVMQYVARSPSDAARNTPTLRPNPAPAVS